MPEEGSAPGRPDAEQAAVVDRAADLLMRRRRVTRSDALDRLRDIAGEVGIKLHEAAALVLSLDES
jgi:AmiR/NasT family two-component response regulator